MKFKFCVNRFLKSHPSIHKFGGQWLVPKTVNIQFVEDFKRKFLIIYKILSIRSSYFTAVCFMYVMESFYQWVILGIFFNIFFRLLYTFNCRYMFDNAVDWNRTWLFWFELSLSIPRSLHYETKMYTIPFPYL